MSSTLVEQRRPAQSPEIDPSTLSNYKLFSFGDAAIFFKVDWHKKILNGLVNYKLTAKSPKATRAIVLDTSFLNISSIAFNGAKISGYETADRNGPLGSALTIPVEFPDAESVLSIEFSTTDECTGLQWLNPEQTSDGTAPYLFSQCQAIHARSLFPCFDTPSVKVPYSMHIQSSYPTLSSGNPVETDSSVLPSGFFSDASDQKIYSFLQNVPIPSYLFSIASGDIKSAKIGPRSLVYTEPGELSACQYEFEADTENFIQAAEKIVFDYSWQTYNVLVLPKSFPYGGMENPNHTFATPTLIDGKRQNVDVIAHELAHSWSGNLVSNCSWNHFYLNEGWTVYLERRIIGAVHGEAHRHFSALIGWKDLEESIKSMTDEDADAYSRLIVDLSGGKDPDDAFSTVPYEKGFNLLFHLENLVGGKEVFDPFIPFYFNKFERKSLDSYQFYDSIYGFFHDKKDLLDTVDWDTWFYTPGLPPKPKFDTSIADVCYSLAARWVAAVEKGDFASFSKSDIESWTSTQSFVFLDTLADGFEGLNVDSSVLAQAASALDKVYSLSTSSNAEVISRWYRLAVGAKLASSYEPLSTWLGTVGRMKFVRPGFRRLDEVDHELALKTFRRNESFYHPICRAMVKKDLGL